MRNIYILIMAMLCLYFAGTAKGQVLAKNISVQYKEVTIEEILKDVTKKYGVKFSYSSNYIPLKRKITITLQNKPLGNLLGEVFKNTDVSYEELGSQVVLKKKTTKEPKSNHSSRDKKTGMNTPYSRDTVKTEPGGIKEQTMVNDSIPSDAYVSATPSFFEEPKLTEEVTKLAEEVSADSIDKSTLRKEYMKEKRRLKRKYYAMLDSIERSSNHKTKGKLKSDFSRAMRDLNDELKVIGDSLSNLKLFRKDTDTTDGKKGSNNDSSGYEFRPAQITFFTPLGTNGTRDIKTVNNFSLNIIAGRAAGVEGVEIGSVANYTRDFMHGVQVGGVCNVVGREVDGVQLAGTVNVAGGRMNGVQASGTANIARREVEGGQISGFMNVAGGELNGVQAAGFMNIAGDTSFGVQAAGFMNLVKEEMNGTQAAGFINVAGTNMDGVQVAGFMNIAPDTLDGVQVAGFMNVAHKVYGSQIGVFNFADSVSGVQVGLLSFSRKGYKRLEVWGSSTFYANVAFKTGSHHFYNIIAAGARVKGSRFTWAWGYGIGTELRLSKLMLMNIDGLCYQFHEQDSDWDELNLLNQLRVNVGIRLSERISIFAGPVVNVMVSDHYDQEAGKYGMRSLIAGPTIYDHTSGNNTNVAIWIGGNVGIRF